MAKKNNTKPLEDAIVQVDSREQYNLDYTRYIIYTLMSRYVPSIMDGLKPVQRRILDSMYLDLGSVSYATRRKSAKITGAVIGDYHPHGDACLSADTKVYCLDGKEYTIGELYENGVKQFETLCVNNEGRIVPAVAYDIRVGQITNKIYHILLTNGKEIKVTGNHPFLLPNGQYVRADQLIPQTRLFNKSMCYVEGRPYIDGRLIQEIVGDYYYGTLQDGYIRHHKDFNKLNNTRNNIDNITRAAHAKEHKDYNKGLEIGRDRMFNQEGHIRQQTIEKNSLLCKLFNQDQGIRRFKHALNILRENNLDLTIENYESLRGKVYNLPIVERLISKGYGESFNDLVQLELPGLDELYSQNKKELSIMCKLIYNSCNEAGVKFNIFNRMDSILDTYGYINYNNYINHGSNISGLTEEEFNYYYGMYLYERPYILDIWIEDVPNTPMYDFTVDGYHNMIIPANNPGDKYMPFICVHNSVYDAMKPMVNWFESQMPILANISSFGTFQGDSAASQRYTETHINKFGVECVIGDLAESDKVVNWVDTFDNSKKEPEYLATKVPLLLINGAFSIAVGVKIEIPSHNINDVIDATISLLDNPKAKIALIPDPPMPCEIVDTNWGAISNAGYGHYTVRGIIKTLHDDKTGIDTLSIQSVPELIFTNQVKKAIEGLILNKKLIQVDDIQDLSTDDQLDLRIILKRGSDPEYVKQVLYAHTQIQKNQRVDAEVLIGYEVKRISYKAYLVHFLEFRRNIKFRLYNYRLQKAETRLHKLDVYIKILCSDDVEGVIKMIRNQSNMDENYVIEWLVKKLNVTDLQAKSILHTEIRALSKGHFNKYKQEQKDLQEVVNNCINMITHPELIDQEIRNELLQIKEKYGHPRRSILIKESDANNIPAGEFKIVITESNFIKKMQIDDPIKAIRGDEAKCVILADNTKDLLLFDEQGKVFRLPVHKIAFTDKNSPGIDVRLLLKNLTSNIRTIMYVPIVEALANKTSKHYIVTVTTKGMIKRMDLDDIINVTPSGIIYSRLNQGDSVKDIIIAGVKNDIVIYTKSKALRMSINSIPHLKRSTLGNKALSSNDDVDGIAVVTSEITDIVVITAKGKFNRFSINGLPVKDRGKAPGSVIKLAKGDSIVNIFSCNPSKNIIRVVRNEGIIDMNINDIPIGSSISPGTKMCKEGIIKCELVRI